MATSKELYDSIAKDDWDGVKSLLDRGLAADAPFSIDYEHLPCTPLQQASGLGALGVIVGLIDRGVDLNYSKTYGTPLYCAVSFDRYEATKLLLIRGAEPNGRGPSQIEGDSKWTPLICAAFRKNIPMVNLLLIHGADPHIVSRRGIGVVTCAAYNQDIELMVTFLQAGAPAPGNALLCAVERENEKLVAALLSAGCDASFVAGKVELADAKAGETPLSFAIKRLSIAKAMSDLQKAMGREQGQQACLRAIIARLLRSRADPNRQVHNRTPLSLAVWDRDVEVVRLLLASGADVTGKTYSPFVEYKDRKSDQLGFYETALHAAVRGGYKEIVEELLTAGANPQDRDHSGVSVLELVRQTADREMTELFKRHAKTEEQR